MPEPQKYVEPWPSGLGLGLRAIVLAVFGVQVLNYKLGLTRCLQSIGDYEPPSPLGV